MQPLLFENDTGSRFQPVSVTGGEYFTSSWVGRGAAGGDLDNDGDTDLVVTHLIEPASLLLNESERACPSLRLRLVGVQSARQPWGVKVEVRSGDHLLTLRTPAGDSFQSASDDRLIVPVAQGSESIEIRVHWPGKPLEEWRTIILSARKNPDQTILIRE